MVNNYDKAPKLMQGHDLEKAPKGCALLEKARQEGDDRATYAIGTRHLHRFYSRKDQIQ